MAMEGPSLVIAAEEFEQFLNLKIQKATGSSALPMAKIKKEQLRLVTSWGKHFLLVFDSFALRIHFLMFGSYRINRPRENRVPKLQLRIAGDEIYFYSCAIKEVASDIEGQYDWSRDIMSKAWTMPKACRKIAETPRRFVCDVLMDQEIFSSVGNIMKNEILYHAHLHPETKVSELDVSSLKGLVKECRSYGKRFYMWKKAGLLNRNWIVFRKKICGVCGHRVTNRVTGRMERVSHYCTRCQPRFK